MQGSVEEEASLPSSGVLLFWLLLLRCNSMYEKETKTKQD